MTQCDCLNCQGLCFTIEPCLKILILLLLEEITDQFEGDAKSKDDSSVDTQFNHCTDEVLLSDANLNRKRKSSNAELLRHDVPRDRVLRIGTRRLPLQMAFRREVDVAYPGKI